MDLAYAEINEQQDLEDQDKNNYNKDKNNSNNKVQ